MARLRARASLALVAWAIALSCTAPNGEYEGATAAAVANCPASPPSWKPGSHYDVKALVSFKGKVFSCLQTHTAIDGWFPDIVPALWQAVPCATGGGAAPPPATPPPATPPPPTAPPPTAPPPVGNSATEYAPYFFAFAWGNPAFPFSGLVDLKAKTGLSSVSLAFVLSDGGCRATRDVQNNKADLAAFRSSGGRAKASFGGASGTYLENACPDDASLAAAISAFVDETGLTDLDFDVEQGPAMTADVNGKRARALKKVQETKGAKISFTVQALPRDKNGVPGGMSAAAVEVVRAAVNAGVKVSIVNLMTMDFGPFFTATGKLGDLAQSAASDAAAQLGALMPGLSSAQAFAMLGVTPMIGVNDVSSEVFSLDDARTLVAFARQKRLGLLSFWAINRDQVCAVANLANCSEVNTANFQFHQIFSAR
jgi:chitinase